MPRFTKQWPPRSRQPWQAEEDAKLVEMARIGLCSEYYGEALPARTFGEILERRLDLREAGQLTLARPI